MARNKVCFRDEIIAASHTAASMSEIAVSVGCSRTHVTLTLQKHLPEAYKRFSEAANHSSVLGKIKRERILAHAPTAASIAEVARLVGCAHRYAARTLRAHAPDEYERLTSRRADEPSGKPVCWNERAHALFPDDEALARSLARAASWQSSKTTIKGEPLRLVPPPNEWAAA